MTPRRVILAGATGLVGGHLLRTLLADPTVTEIHVLARRKLDISDKKLTVHTVDFKELPTLPEADEVYLALGTTIKVAGSRAAFRAVDFTANLNVAQAAHDAGARRIGLVSAAGANARSSVFYSRVKGELEEALEQMDLDALVIARPSLLLGSRAGLGQPSRPMERFMTPVSKLLAPVTPGIYKPVEAQAVARSLVNVLPNAVGTVIVPSNQLAAWQGLSD